MSQTMGADFTKVMEQLEQAIQKHDIQWLQKVASNPDEALRSYKLSADEKNVIRQQALRALRRPPKDPPKKWPP